MDFDELELVRKATLSRVTGDCEWDEKAARRVRKDRHLKGLTPEGIRTCLQSHVEGGGEIVQVAEKREAYRDHRSFYYKVIVPQPDLFKKGLFIEIVIVDDDPQDPAVRIVNAHEQKR